MHALPKLTIKNEIDPVGFAALALSVLLSLVFYRRFEGRKHSDQLRRLFICERIGRVKTELSSLNAACDEVSIDFATVVRRIKAIGTEIQFFSNCTKKLEIETTDDLVLRLRKCRNELRLKITNTPIDPLEQGHVQHANGKLSLSEVRRAELDGLFREAWDTLIDLEIAALSS
jgi:hypothetical protein